MSDTHQAAKAAWRKLIHADPCLTDEQSIEVIRVALAQARKDALEQAAGMLERAAGASTSENVEGCGNYDDVAEAAVNDALRYHAHAIRQAKEE